MRGPRFAPGDAVRVADRRPAGHNRTPRYLRGRIGVVERHCGAFPNPEDLAHGGDGLPPPDLYRVHFPQTALWPGYAGAPGDSLEVEIYDHWLEPAEIRDAP